MRNDEKNKSLFISVISVNPHLLAENEVGLQSDSNGHRQHLLPERIPCTPQTLAHLQQGFAASPYFILPLFLVSMPVNMPPQANNTKLLGPHLICY